MIEAPRWRLMSAHYIRVPELPDGTKMEWEHKETALESGRTVRKLYSVPMLLDPKDAADHNYPGEIIVTHEVEGAHLVLKDYIFLGDPTQEMEPLNEAAEVISASLRDKWEHPINNLPSNGNMSTEEQVFMEKMMISFAREIGASLPKTNIAVPDAEKEELKARLARLEELIAAQNQPKPEATVGRRV